MWHFSEDPAIARFRPHVATTSTHTRPYVWACSSARCPDYWFPRDTPRAMAWRLPDSDSLVADMLLGPRVQRLHVIEHDSVDAMRTTALYAYRFAAAGFTELEGFAQVSEVEQVPLGPPVPLATPWELHRQAGLPVLVVADLFEWWSLVVRSDLGFSGIRLSRSPRYRPVG